MNTAFSSIEVKSRSTPLDIDNAFNPNEQLITKIFTNKSSLLFSL